jgi:uncharacterized SAM-binding protein YcdF (DUF218 family)
LVSRLFFIAGLLGFLALVLGFIGFSDHVTGLEAPAQVPRADGAAALTGGSDARLRGGIDLVARRTVPRLLISGVNAKASVEEVARVAGGDAALFACCVDLGRTATDTVGNAREVAQWAREHRIKRLILITDNYHMPRSLLEVRRANPGLDVIAYPVRAAGYVNPQWWKDRKTTRGLALEYGKLLVAMARARLADWAEASSS